MYSLLCSFRRLAFASFQVKIPELSRHRVLNLGQASGQSSSLVAHYSLFSCCSFPTSQHVLAEGPGGWARRQTTSCNPTESTVQLCWFWRPGTHSDNIRVFLVCMHVVPSRRPGWFNKLVPEKFSSLCVPCRVTFVDGEVQLPHLPAKPVVNR